MRKYYIPLPWMILLPYWFISFLFHLLIRLIRKNEYSKRDKQVLKWLAKPDDPLRPQDYRAKHVAKLRGAIKARQSVYLKYVTKGGQSARRIHPERIFRRGNYIYVEAFCFKAGEYRRFRLDRIEYLS